MLDLCQKCNFESKTFNKRNIPNFISAVLARTKFRKNPPNNYTDDKTSFAQIIFWSDVLSFQVTIFAWKLKFSKLLSLLQECTTQIRAVVYHKSQDKFSFWYLEKFLFKILQNKSCLWKLSGPGWMIEIIIYFFSIFQQIN